MFTVTDRATQGRNFRELVQQQQVGFIWNASRCATSDVRDCPVIPLRRSRLHKMATAWLEFAEEAREKYPPPPPKKKKKNKWDLTDSESEEDEEQQALEEEGEGDHTPNEGTFLTQLVRLQRRLCACKS